MDMDLLSGLLLTAVVLLILAYVLKELFGDSVTAFFSEYSAKASTGTADANHHLIGAVGRVVDQSAGADAQMKVRIGIERWKAKLAAPDAPALPVGTAVKILGVDGPVLQVEQVEESPSQSPAGPS